MTAPEVTARATSAAAGTGNRARATLGTCGAAHFLHDGFSDVLYVLLPLWAQAFGLSLTQVGLLKSLYMGALALFQIPAGLLAERWGERVLLAAGTAVAGLGFVFLGLSGGFAGLIAVLVFIGSASATQHPLSSTLVARAYEGGRRRAALGIYNLTGDLGKVAMPALMALGIAAIGWRGSAMAFGAFGVLGAAGIFLALRRLGAGAAPAADPGKSPRAAREGGWGIHDRRGFQVLSAITVVDFSTRTAFLTLLPFLLIAKGAAAENVGFALALVFAGGAAGKFLCGLLAERFGIIRTVVLTELVTGAGILALLALPLNPALAFLPVVGLALNGTSSVLYGTVAEFVVPERQPRAFGLFYTIGTGAGAAGPLVYGLLGDLTSVPVALATVGVVALTTIPLSRLLAPSVAGGGGERA